MIPIYIDLNLIYRDPGLDRYVPLTPSAGQAILSHLRANRGNLPPDDARNSIVHAKNRDEAARPFKRCIINALLLLDTFTLETHRLDGSNVVREKISCNQIFPLPKPTSDILFTNSFSLILSDHCKTSPSAVNCFMKRCLQIRCWSPQHLTIP